MAIWNVDANRWEDRGVNVTEAAVVPAPEVVDHVAAEPAADPLAALPSELRTLVERYGRASLELGLRLGQDPHMAEVRRMALHESVALAERRLAQALA